MYVTRAFFVWTLQNDKKPLLSTHLPETSSSRKRKSHNLQPKHADEIHVKIECDEQKHNITSPSLKKQTAGKTTSVPSSVRKRKNIGVRCCVACGLVIKKLWFAEKVPRYAHVCAQWAKFLGMLNLWAQLHVSPNATQAPCTSAFSTLSQWHVC